MNPTYEFEMVRSLIQILGIPGLSVSIKAPVEEALERIMIQWNKTTMTAYSGIIQ